MLLIQSFATEIEIKAEPLTTNKILKSEKIAVTTDVGNEVSKCRLRSTMPYFVILTILMKIKVRILFLKVDETLGKFLIFNSLSNVL